MTGMPPTKLLRKRRLRKMSPSAMMTLMIRRFSPRSLSRHCLMLNFKSVDRKEKSYATPRIVKFPTRVTKLAHIRTGLTGIASVPSVRIAGSSAPAGHSVRTGPNRGRSSRICPRRWQQKRRAISLERARCSYRLPERSPMPPSNYPSNHPSSHLSTRPSEGPSERPPNRLSQPPSNRPSDLLP